MQSLGDRGREAVSHEEKDDQRGEEEVYANRVEVLATNCFEVEDYFESIDYGYDEEKSYGYDPQDEVYMRADMEVGCGGRGGEGFPHYSLTANTKTDAEGSDGKA